MKQTHAFLAAMLVAAAAAMTTPPLLTAQTSGSTVPDTIEVNGTTYVDCRAVEGYPFALNGKISTMEGRATTEMGTRSFPWMCSAVGGLLLFRASDGEPIYDPQFDGRRITVRGHTGAGEVSADNFLTGEKMSKHIDNGFIVSEIVGWVFAEGYPRNDSGEVSNARARFWVKIAEK